MKIFKSASTLLLFLLDAPSFTNGSTQVSNYSPKTIIQPSADISSSDSISNSFTDTSIISTCTDAAKLATDFQKALVAVNQERDEIHVGHLLSACEGLETTMRKIGFHQSASDIAANLAKIRTIYLQVSPNKRNSMPELLQYEVNLGIHGHNDQIKSKFIKDSSATMGFLWLGRSLNYQYDMFEQLLLDGNIQPYEAACCAYERNMKPHLSWPLRKVCQVALRQLKMIRRENILAGIGGFAEERYGACEDQATKNDLRQVLCCLEPMLGRWRQVFSEMGLEEI